jgi:hypothetical protein
VRKRIDGLARVARELGFAFERKPDSAFLSQLDGLRISGSWGSREVANALHGEARGIRVAIFDHCYAMVETVILFRSQMLHLPSFFLHPPDLADYAVRLLGVQPIVFEGHPTFSKNYVLEGPDGEALLEAFADAVVSFYETKTDLWTEGEGDRLLLYRLDKLVEPHEVKCFLEEGFQLFELFACGRPRCREGT